MQSVRPRMHWVTDILFLFLIVFYGNCHNEKQNSVDSNNEVRPMDIDILTRGLISETRTNMSPRIVGGNPAEPGMFPYQAAILIYLDKSTRYYFCGGVLISSDFVLTAAHCCESALRFTIVLGATNFKINEPTQIRVNATIKVIHPKWDNTTLANDICMIKLSQSVKFTEYVKPIKIWNKPKSECFGVYATLSGWGRTNDISLAVNNELRYISVPIIPTCGVCQECYSLLFNGNICTSSNNGMSPCNGDSGGPMIVTDDNGIEYLAGVVSYGHVKGCQLGYPAVQTYVPCYLKWINKVAYYYQPDDCECTLDMCY